MEKREMLHKGWQALRKACRDQHPGGPGGARICICGAACGGSEACSMLGTLRDLIVYLPTDTLPQEWRDHLEALRKIV